MKKLLVNGGVLCAALIVGLLLCEAGARLFLEPADYLSVRIVRDDILGIRITPGSSGFDEWGFRNPSVPASADIVTVGDSHTYGNNATRDDSWPYVAGRITGRSVYNLGLGGYGPNQYYHLLSTYAATLKPRVVLCGLYLGDDFENAFKMTYGRDYWSPLRQGEWSAVDADIWEGSEEDLPWHKRFRNWLSESSVVYRVVVHGPVLGQVKGAIQIRRAAKERDPEVTTLYVPEDNIMEAFRPIGMRDRLDQGSGPVREGMRITFDLLGRMNQLSREHGAEFVVVLIPTKETVFAEYLLRSPDLHLQDAIASLVANEDLARKELIGFLDSQGVRYVDTLAALRGNLKNQLYTSSDKDMHPDKEGYEVIGEAVAEFLGR